ncbi:hypothetical protein M0R45_005887 [Rubus argutus]|uniref:Uncharacterized protein n=1 Tax=Rubus argutus TaxID=59490 RepID=A0AAW1YP96_RUBAR
MDVARKSSGAKYEYLLFDLDDTLYPMSSGLNLACRKNIEEYMLQHLQIEESEVPRMCLQLYREYGTTMAGLKALGYEFDNDQFHACVHGRLPYDALKPDLVLRNLLLSMPQRKIIFTNGDEAHAAQVLSRLCLEDCFEGIICFETLNPPSHLQPVDFITAPDDDDIEHAPEATVTDCIGSNLSPKSPILCKPSVEAIEAAIRIANVDPQKTIFFDDSARNIASGKGSRTSYSYCWEFRAREEGQQLEQFIQSTAVETVVHA